MLSPGQRLPLDRLGVGQQLEVVLSASGVSPEYDWACALTAGGKLLGLEWLICFSQPLSPDGAVQWRRSAGGVAFSLDLTRLDPRAERLVITLSPERGEGILSGLRCGELRLGAESWRFSGADFGSEQAIIAAELYRHQGAWRLMVVGQGFTRLAGLADYLGSPLMALSAPKKPPSPSPKSR